MDEFAVRIDRCVVSGFRCNLVAGDQDGHGSTYAGLSRGGAHGTRDDSRCRTVGRVHGHIAGMIGILCDIDFDIVAEFCLDCVVRYRHREGTGERKFTAVLTGIVFIALCLRHHRAGDGFDIGVLSGQEVQRVKCLQQFIAGEVDVDFVAFVVITLVHVYQSCIRFLALFITQIAGIGDQIAPVEKLQVIRGHSLLLRVQSERVAGDLGIAADRGRHDVFTDDIRGSDAHTDSGALGDAQSAGAGTEAALVGRLNGDAFAFQPACSFRAASGYIHRGFRGGDQHADRTAEADA